MIGTTDDIVINKTYYFAFSADDRVKKKGRVLGYTKEFGEYHIFFQILTKKHAGRNSYTLNEIGIGNTPQEAKQSYSKIKFGNEQFLYNVNELKEKVIVVGNIVGNVPNHANKYKLENIDYENSHRKY